MDTSRTLLEEKVIANILLHILLKKIYKNDKKIKTHYKSITQDFEKSLKNYNGEFIVVSNWFPLDKIKDLEKKLKKVIRLIDIHLSMVMNILFYMKN